MKHSELKHTVKRTVSLLLLSLCIFSTACTGGETAQTDTSAENTDTSVTTDVPDITVFPDTLPVEDTFEVTDTDVPATEIVTDEITTHFAESDTTVPTEDTASPDTTADVTTAPETTPPVPTEKTDPPVVLGKCSQAGDRVIIYGTTEYGATITYIDEDSNKYSDKACGHNFYIEVAGTGKKQITLYATASGKKDSNKVHVSVSFGGDQTAVFAGRNSHLFYRPTVPHLLGGVKANENMLAYTANRLSYVLKEVRKCTGKDTKLIYLIAPNPATIYYDEQHDYLLNAIGGKQHSTPGSQFVDYMNGAGKKEGIIVPDLLDVFNEHKDEMIYFSTDTHWSELGAYYAYVEMMTHINKDFPAAKPHPLSDFDVEIVDCPAGDLSGMLGAHNMREETPFLIAKFEDTGDIYPVKRGDDIGYRVAGINWGLYPKDSYIDNPSLPTAMGISDSYGAYFFPFAGMGFKHFRFHGANDNTPLSLDTIAECKPDYIIFVYTDRNIDSNIGMVTHMWSGI